MVLASLDTLDRSIALVQPTPTEAPSQKLYTVRQQHQIRSVVLLLLKAQRLAQPATCEYPPAAAEIATAPTLLCLDGELIPIEAIECERLVSFAIAHFERVRSTQDLYEIYHSFHQILFEITFC